jgi:DNA-binding CsgD family transcriptional regulator/tetratricopeptide (TPR) repeat protein
LLSCLGMAADQMGRFAEARAYLEESLGLSEEADDTAGVAEALFHLGVLLGRMGELAKAKGYLDTARGLDEQLGQITNVAFSIKELGRIYRLEHRLDEATDLLEWSLARLEQAQIQHVQGPIHYELGEVALQRKDLPRATEQFQLALRLLREANIVDEDVAGSVTGLARVLLLRRMPELAIQAVAAVDAWRKTSGFRAAPHAAISWTKQLVAARQDVGLDRFNVAWEQGRRITLLAAADVVCAVGIPAGTPSPATHRRTVAGMNNLTKQEHRVLCLIANGLSNQQIADSLSITVRTAANHVTNILGKFNVENRTQAAAMAMRHDLCPSPGPMNAAS